MSNKDKIHPRLLSVESTAKFLGINPKTIRNRLGPKAPDPFPVKPKRLFKYAPKSLLDPC